MFNSFCCWGTMNSSKYQEDQDSNAKKKEMPNVINTEMGTSQYVIKSASSDNWSHRNGEYNSKIPIKITRNID